MPFNAKLRSFWAPTAIGVFSADELNAELMKGYESIKHDRKYSPDEVDDILKQEFDICWRNTK